MKIIIFGASGDLAKRKLFPALSRINTEGVEIIGYARTKFKKPFTKVISELYTYKQEFLDRITYITGGYEDFTELKGLITPDTSLYMSVPPKVYKIILDGLEGVEYKNVCIEKPFGQDYDDLNQIKESNIDKILFIDHYLLKPMSVAWPFLVSENLKLRNILDSQHVSSVEVVFKEAIGGEGRLYFDEHGLVKDVVQNHLSELVVISAQEPRAYSCCLQSEERIHVLRNTSVVNELSIFGQYDSYQEEMKKASQTETYSVVTLEINNKRWMGVPFITIAGKGLNEKRTEIVYTFKDSSYQDVLDILNNPSDVYLHISNIAYVRLVCNLAPDNKVFIEVGIEGKDSLCYVLFDSTVLNSILAKKYGQLENHEIIFDCLIKSKDFDCVHFCEAELLWKIFNDVLAKEKLIFKYSKDIDIPNEAIEKILHVKEKYKKD